MTRIRFAVRYKTIRRAVVTPGDPATISVYYRGQTLQLPRRCPHQGAPLESGYFAGDDLHCPWHGCRFKLADYARNARCP
jgi:nitrite reductase/ring-hydroxylating ferredoxin subunit